jgi:hypothetical protein
MELEKQLRVAACAMVLFTLWLSAAASAQSTPQTGVESPKFLFNVGAAFLTGDSPRKTEFSFGVGYERPIYRKERDPLQRSMIGFQLDYVPVKSNVEHRGTITTMPEIIYFKRIWPSGKNRFWGTIGAGYRYCAWDVPESKLHVDQNPSWMVGVGYDFTTKYYAEMRFIGGEHTSDCGVLLTKVGFRF